MRRREFLEAAAAGGLFSALPRMAFAAPGANHGKLLVLIELKGGNDGLNTVIPYHDSRYYGLRPRIAVRREQVLQLTEQTGLHPSLGALIALWRSGELAVVQGVGYPNPNLSHFRSIEIWDTGSASEQILNEGWLARAFAAHPVPRDYAADGVVIGSQEMGPLAGGARAVALSDPERFLRQAQLAAPAVKHGNAALNHILKVEQDIVQAASRLRTNATTIATQFPNGPFGNAIRTAAQVLASQAQVAAVRVTLSGFDTHQNQLVQHSNLLKQLAEGLVSLKSALMELNRWDSTLVMTYAEFGRRPAENVSGGTDHGTASAHFVMGGRVRGGIYGEAPRLDRLDDGNLVHAVDFRSLYSTVLEKWWRVPSHGVLGRRFPVVDIIKA